MNITESVLKLLEKGTSTREPGDVVRFLSSRRNSRILEDTRGFVYYFKKTISKRNKFGKGCTCGVWRCRQYRRFYCSCAVYTFGDTIIGSTGPHNHLPVTQVTNKRRPAIKDSTDDINPAAQIPTELLKKIRQHNHGPKVESVKRSVHRARQHLAKRRRKQSRQTGQNKTENCRKSRDVLVPSQPTISAKAPISAASQSIVPNVTVPRGAANKLWSSTMFDPVSQKFVPAKTPVIGLCVPVTTACSVAMTTPNLCSVAMTTPNLCSVAMTTPNFLDTTNGTFAQTEVKHDTLNEILDILNEMSKSSSPSYDLLCNQLLQESAGIVTSSAAVTTAPLVSSDAPSLAALRSRDLYSRGTISAITVPLHDIPTFSAPAIVASSSQPQTFSSSLSCQPQTLSSLSSTSFSHLGIPAIVSTRASLPDVSIISSNFHTSDILRTPGPPPNVYPLKAVPPPPNVTINTCYTSAPSPAVNPQLRPIINLPSLYDNTPHTPPPPPVSTHMTSQPVSPIPTHVQSPPVTSSSSSPGEELPSKSEYTILSDMSSLENLLDILQENNPLREPMVRCTCRTMLRCSLHDTGKKKKPAPRLRRKSSEEMKKPARKKYCYRGSKKPYKFIPEVFKDCQLPANDQTVIGHNPAAQEPKKEVKARRGGRKARITRPINIPPPNPPAILPVHPSANRGPPISPTLKSISPAPPPKPSNTISLVPVSSMSGNNLENSKLLKAVPIGNGLYRLEEANESEMACDALSKPVYQADINLNNLNPLGNLTTLFNQQVTHKPSNLVEHRPNMGGGIIEHRPHLAPHFPVAPIVDNDLMSRQLDNILHSVLNSINMSAKVESVPLMMSSKVESVPFMMNSKMESVPLMIPANNGVSELGQYPILGTSSLDQATSSPTIINQLIERLMSVDSTEEKILEALNLTIPGIIQH